MVRGGMYQATKIFERIENSYRYMTQPVLHNNGVSMGIINYAKVSSFRNLLG